MDGIVHEKTLLWKGLGENQPAVVNLDDERLVQASKTLKAPVVTYSLKDGSAHVKPAGALEVREDATVFPLLLGAKQILVRLPVLGLHQVQNAVAAAAVAWALGEAPETIAEGLARHLPVKQRMQVFHLPDGRVLIDDSYNANPGSMYGAVQAARSGSGENPLIVILGEMRELGPTSAALHRELGKKIAMLGVSRLVTLGDMGAEIVCGAEAAGMPDAACHSARTHEEILSWLRANRFDNAWILVKGSRAMAMERVVEGILNE
jgi:UDP-N-acetylmuramoyl-tripeptide--D-alanyl-D-alanine ligase